MFAGEVCSQSQPNPLALPGCIKLREKLSEPSAYAIQNTPLRNIAEDCRKIFGIQVILDRRIDLDSSFDLKEPEQPLEVTLDHIAQRFDAEIAWIENVIYICPKSRAARIEAAYWNLYQEIAKGSKKGSSFQWKRLETPANIVARWCKANDLQSDDPGAIEHDLWDAGELKDCSLAAQITVLLAGFDLTADIDWKEKHIAWKALPEETNVRGKYVPMKLDDQAIQAWKDRWPQSKSQFAKKEWNILAPPKAHRDLILVTKSKKQGSTNGKDPLANVFFPAPQIQGRLGDVLEELQKQYQFEIEPWPIPKELFEAMVQVDDKKLNMDQLLKAIGDSCGATITRDRLRLRVTKK